MDFVNEEFNLFQKTYGLEQKKAQPKMTEKKVPVEPKKNEPKVIQLEASASDGNEEEIMLDSGEGKLKQQSDNSESEESEEVAAPQIRKQAPPVRITPDLERYLSQKINRTENTKQKPVASEFTFGLIFGKLSKTTSIFGF